MSREDLARALAPRGHLSRMEKEAIWRRIAVARQPRWRRPAVWLGCSVATAAVAVIALVVMRPAPRHAELTARGTAQATVTLRCSVNREPGDCRIGEHLRFEVGTLDPNAYIALFARSEAAGVIWYVPSDDATSSVPLAAHTTAGVLDTAAVLDASYGPGRYELFAIVSDRALSRADIRAFAHGEQMIAPPGTTIIRRAFVVTPKAEETSP
jgi:anti-sigma-K factor RskA